MWIFCIITDRLTLAQQRRSLTNTHCSVKPLKATPRWRKYLNAQSTQQPCAHSLMPVVDVKLITQQTTLPSPQFVTLIQPGDCKMLFLILILIRTLVSHCISADKRTPVKGLSHSQTEYRVPFFSIYSIVKTFWVTSAPSIMIALNLEGSARSLAWQRPLWMEVIHSEKQFWNWLCHRLQKKYPSGCERAV